MKKISLFSLICCLAFSLTAQDKVGVQLYSFRNQFKTDVPGTLKAIREMGITYVEGGDSYGLPIKDIKMLLGKTNSRSSVWVAITTN